MIRNFFKLSLGNATAQGVQWLALIGCIHFYSAATYGYFYAGISAIGMIGILSSLQMHQAIVIAKDREEVEGIFRVGIISNLVVMLFAVMVVTLLVWTGHLHMDPLYQWALAWIMFTAGLGRIYQGWFVKIGGFGFISRGILFRAVTLSIIQLVLGWFKIEHGLVLGTLAGEMALVGYMATRQQSPSLRSILKLVNTGRISKLLRAYDDFAVGGTLSECVSTVAFSLPVVLFGWRFSATESGHFSLSHRLIWAPIMMLGSALAQVLYKRLSEPTGSDFYKNRVFRSFGWLIIGAAMASFLLGYTLPLLLKPFMKNSWAGAYAYMAPLIGWSAFFLLGTSYRISYRVLRLQRIQLVIDTVFLIWMGGLFYLIAPRVTGLYFCYILGISGMLHQLLLMVYIRARIENKMIVECGAAQ